MSVRDDPVLFLQQGKGKTTGGSSVGGGSAITTTHVHRLNGPEHTLATDDDRLNATGGEPGLLPKLSGIPTDTLHGDGTWSTDEASSDDCTPVPHGSLGAAETFDPADGEIHTMTLTADCTVTLTAPDCDASFMEWWVTEDGTGGWEFAWPGSVTEEGTHDTTLSATQRVILETVDGGTSWIATWIGSASASFATPAIALGSSAAAGAASTVIRSDATIAAFDGTVPVTQAFSDAAATGSAAFAARRDHKHGMPATPASGGAADHEHILNVVFSGDGSTTVWELPAAPVDASSIAVYVTASRSIAWALSGTLLTTLTFDSAPASAANNIVIDIVAAVA